MVHGTTHSMHTSAVYSLFVWFVWHNTVFDSIDSLDETDKRACGMVILTKGESEHQNIRPSFRLSFGPSLRLGFGKCWGQPGLKGFERDL